jgi:hypothetical protein
LEVGHEISDSFIEVALPILNSTTTNSSVLTLCKRPSLSLMMPDFCQWQEDYFYGRATREDRPKRDAEADAALDAKLQIVADNLGFIREKP